MKTILKIIILFSALGYANVIWAQDPKPERPAIYNRFEFNLGYGRLSPYELISETGYDVNKYSGSFTLTSRYFITNKLAVGLAVSIEKESGNWGDNYSDPPVIPIPPLYNGTFKRASYTFAPEISYSYATSPGGKTRVYASCAAGITYINEVDAYSTAYYEFMYHNGVNVLGNHMELNNNSTKFSGYISPIGLRVGRTLSAFVELGYGFKGVINGGLTLKIK